MEKYKRVVDANSTADVYPKEEYVVRVNVSGKLSNYIGYAEAQLESCGKAELVALGRAINRAVTVAEILRRNAAVHQLITLRSVSITDKYEPLEEGLKTLEMNRTMSSISIVLARDAGDVDTKAPGYAAPLDSADPISEEYIAEMDNERNGRTSADGERRSRGCRDGRKRSTRRFRRNAAPKSEPKEGEQLEET